MQILSYRGPSQPGGVATLLQSAANPNDSWWYIKEDQLHGTSVNGQRFGSAISQEILEGHYRFCNEFLWPLMHERGDLAQFNDLDYRNYKLLNIIIGSHVSWHVRGQETFVHDYQLALIPQALREPHSSVGLFWHIPFPQSFPEFAYGALSEIVHGMLKCDVIAFHTAEYVANFASFVCEVEPTAHFSPDHSILLIGHRKIQLVVAPASIDFSFWKTMSSGQEPYMVPELKYVLSVDRADYSKGVLERISGIDLFFERNPHLRGKIQFVMFCQRSRQGLAEYDKYWEQLSERFERVRTKYSALGWSPMLWYKNPVSAQTLAAWYRDAAAMLITPSRDGLNLTAKEFVACANSSTGPLVLSRGAGAWQELQSGVITIDRITPDLIAQSVEDALLQAPYKTQRNLQAMQRIIRKNSFASWWSRLVMALDRNVVSTSSEVGVA